MKKPCPCCAATNEQFTYPTACDDIEYVVCQNCGLRVASESWNCIPRVGDMTNPNAGCDQMILVPVEPTAANRVQFETYTSLRYPAANEHYRFEHYWNAMIQMNKVLR